MPKARSQSAWLGLKGMLIFVLSFPLLLKALVSLWGGQVGGLLANAVAYGLFVLGGMLLRRGVASEKRYAAQPLALYRPLPLKAIAAAIIGMATVLAAFAAVGHGLIISVLFGVGAAGGVMLYYGFDPEPRSLAIAGRGAGADELRTALQDAYAKLESIDEARRDIRSLEFQQRLSAIVARSQDILKAIEQDPQDLRRARKFLNVYLDGLLDVTRQYGRAHPRTQSDQLEQNYRALLVDMESICREQQKKLGQQDADDLDMHIEVLSKRLKREGVP
ncbi:MAG: 5-bromo-4-chloroindolyl phosphate hydrolysis family protein [Gammaproteobacteria bacterium]